MNTEKQMVTIKNPSPEEVEKEQESRLQEAVPIHKDMNNKVVNPFEPKPYEFTIPSGTFIQGTEGKLLVRRMTTIEEAIIQTSIARLNNEKKDMTIMTFFEIFNDIFNNCIKSSIGVSELSLIDKMSLIIFIITKTYGSKVKESCRCIYCDKEQVIEADVDKCTTRVMPEGFVPKELKLKSFDFDVTVSLTVPMIKDETYFFGVVPDLMHQYMSVVQGVTGIKPTGESITEDDIYDIVANLDKDDKDAIEVFIKEALGFGIDLCVKSGFECNNPKCISKQKKGKDRRQPYDIGIGSILNKLL